jgi:benzaldehyde dehydrogenase (NAD)
MSFLTSDWGGKIFASSWTDGGGPPIRVTEPATGKQLADLGTASTEDVAKAAGLAAAAQEAWQTAPPSERAAVLRRAGSLFDEHAE